MWIRIQAGFIIVHFSTYRSVYRLIWMYTFIVLFSVSLWPICTREITNPTVCQTGFVFCYPCVFRWVQGGEDGAEEEKRDRCPVTGVRLLGGTEGLRRLMV